MIPPFRISYAPAKKDKKTSTYVNHHIYWPFKKRYSIVGKLYTIADGLARIILNSLSYLIMFTCRQNKESHSIHCKYVFLVQPHPCKKQSFLISWTADNDHKQIQPSRYMNSSKIFSANFFLFRFYWFGKYVQHLIFISNQSRIMIKTKDIISQCNFKPFVMLWNAAAKPFISLMG